MGKLFALSLALLVGGHLSAKEGGTSMTDSLQKKIVFQKEGKSVGVLFSDGFKAVGIGLMKGQMLEKHNTPTPAFLFVHEGSVEFRMNDKRHILKAGDYFKIPAKDEHEIIGLEDSRLILVK